MKRAMRVLAIASLILLGVHSSRAQWSQDTLPYGGAVFSFAVSDTNLFVGTDTGGVFLTTDDGTSWTAVDSGLSNSRVNGLAVSGTNIFAAINGGGIFLSTNSGTSWAAVNNGIYDLWMFSVGTSGTNILAGCEGGLIFLSTDNGNDWSSVTTGLSSSNITAFVVNDDSLFAASFGEGIIRSADNGNTWTPVDSGLTNMTVTCLATVGTNLFAGTYGGIFLSTNNGVSWTPVDSGLTTNYFSAFAVTGTSLFAGVYIGGSSVFETSDTGTVWYDTSGVLPYSERINALLAKDMYVFAGTPDGLFRLTLPVGFPVELTSFTATATSLTTMLTWKTATEVNNAGFDIQRRLGSTQQWTKVGSVAGAGTSNKPHSYSYTDKVGTAGTYSYRLKQIDHNGAFTYSQQVQVAVGGAPRVLGLSQNFPNPFNPTTNMQFTVPTDGRATLKVYNTIGQLVATLFDGVATAGQYNQATFDGSRLASGIYFSRLEFSGKTELKKMLLLK